MAEDNEPVVKLLEEIRSLQQKSLDTQRQLAMFVLPIFALLTISIVLGLTGFFFEH